MNRSSHQIIIVLIVVIVILSSFVLSGHILIFKNKNKISPLESFLYRGEQIKINSFAVYYGSNNNSSVINYLNQFSAVVLQPDSFSRANLSSIRAFKIAYIDLGEFDNQTPPNCTINASSIEIGYDFNWSQPIINISSPIWFKYIRCEIKYANSIGFQGILFDDLDVVQDYPFEINGFINIVNAMTIEFPDLVFGVNRGFQLIPYIHRDLGFVLYEDFGTFFNFTNGSLGSYSYLNSSQLGNLSSRVQMLKNYSLAIFGLGYSPNPYKIGDPYTEFVDTLGIRYGVITYLSNVTLSYISS